LLFSKYFSLKRYKAAAAATGAAVNSSNYVHLETKILTSTLKLILSD